LRRTLQDIRSEMASHGSEHVAEPSEEDPLKLHGVMLRELDNYVVALHEAGTDWAQSALSRARRGLFEAAEVQRKLIDAAAAASRS
jgi:hypothetical protein